jgi:hypothetical protein
MKLIKKSEKLLQETKATEEIKEKNLQSESIDVQNPKIGEQVEADIQYPEPNYITARDNPVILSVGKTGWQVSDIWKDIRLDSFY